MKNRKLRIKDKSYSRNDHVLSAPSGCRPNLAGTVASLAGPLCEAEGMEFVHVEYVSEDSGKILRVYIDRPTGVSLEDCVYVSRQLSSMLDVEFETKASYRLEVSSPGPDRPIGRKEDFERFKGCPVKIRMVKSINGQKNFTGVIKGLSDDQVVLQVEDRIIHLNYEEIARARLIKYNGEK